MRLLAVAAVALFLAADPSSAEALTVREKNLLEYTTTRTQAVTQSPACRVIEETRAGYNRVGGRLWSLTLRARYCWTQTASGRYKLTEAIFTPKPWAAWWALWQFEGFVTDQGWGGVGQKEAGRHVVGRFRLCAFVKVAPLCPGDEYPWVTIRVFARGGWQQTSGG
jgi:hypothetical protein